MHVQALPCYLSAPSLPCSCLGLLAVLQVYILRKAVAGVSNEVRAFHNWEQEHIKHYREPPKPEMVAWRQRMADCFGFNFTQVG